MRPSDVPTYVEAGAADLGITGKDVLAEQSERAVYELVDLRYGPCVMIFATTAGHHRAAGALRRLRAVPVATKDPPIARRHLDPPRRQAGTGRGKGARGAPPPPRPARGA